MYHFNIEFEFDPEKSRQNLQKHGISFEEAQTMWRVSGVVVEARTGDEVRWIRIVLWKGRFYSCVYTFRERVIRLISVRRSWKKEETIYEETLKNEKKGEKD